MFSDDKTIRSIQLIQLDLLRELFRVCDKYGLKVWADGGTLLGTVREKGFIPWDDDIDMALFREDYDKLVAVAPKEFQHPYFFQCGYTEKTCPQAFSKLRMDGTTAMLPYPKFANTHMGIFIDIFSYDAVPDDPEKLEKQLKIRDKLFAKMLRAAKFDWLRPIESLAAWRYRYSFGKLLNKYEDLFREYKIADNRKVASWSFNVVRNVLYDKELFGFLIDMPFEDVSMPVPVGYHKILTIMYGDYMTPVKAPSMHGEFWKLDPDTDYKVYLPEFKKFCRQFTREETKQRVRIVFKKITDIIKRNR
ncbi:MAG: LicD family protein [Bacteroidales bacterium]|nr:LicD family protein [Bacteroidales bacterium]